MLIRGHESEGGLRKSLRELFESMYSFHTRGVGKVDESLVVGWCAAAAGEAFDYRDEAGVEAEEDCGEGRLRFSYLLID
jgi:hypothetical protein